KQLDNTLVNALTHRELPFEKMLEGTSLERDTAYTPIFQVFYSFQNTPLDLSALNFDEQQNNYWKIEETEHRSAKFDLTLSFIEFQKALQGELEFSSDLWSQHSAQALVDSYLHLLQCLLNDALTQPLLSLPLTKQNALLLSHLNNELAKAENT